MLSALASLSTCRSATDGRVGYICARGRLWNAARHPVCLPVLPLMLQNCFPRSEFANEIPVNEEDEEAAANSHIQSVMPKAGARMSFTAPQTLLSENEKEGEMVDPMEAHRASRVSDREDEYKARRRQRIISPERHDPFAAGDQVALKFLRPQLLVQRCTLNSCLVSDARASSLCRRRRLQECARMEISWRNNSCRRKEKLSCDKWPKRWKRRKRIRNEQQVEPWRVVERRRGDAGTRLQAQARPKRLLLPRSSAARRPCSEAPLQ